LRSVTTDLQQFLWKYPAIAILFLIYCKSPPQSPEKRRLMPRILFNITHGFQARMLLRSKISQRLLDAGVELIVVAPNVNEEYFRQEFTHPQITLYESPGKFSRVEAYLINLRQYFLMNPSLGGTLNQKNETFRRNSPWFARFARAVNLVVGRIGILRRAYMKAEEKIFSGRDHDELLSTQKPDLVVTGTPGYTRDDIHLIRAAKRHRIPTATVMLSWDNLTSKGYMGAVPDQLLVWSDLMADEAVQYHNYPRERITWVGAAQFDHYANFAQSFDRLAWRRAHGIADDAALLMYGTINPALVPHEVNIVRGIVEQIQSGKFSKPIHLWIRLHPQVVQGYYKQDLSEYEQFASPTITVEKPPVHESKLSWDLPKEDAIHLASLLAASDIVITPNSTLSIDAACLDRPIVNIFHDGPKLDAKEMSAQRFMHYTHYAKILQTGGISCSMRHEDFPELVNQYLMNPEFKHNERQAILAQQFNQFDGQSAHRTAKKLLALTASGAMT